MPGPATTTTAPSIRSGMTSSSSSEDFWEQFMGSSVEAPPAYGKQNKCTVLSAMRQKVKKLLRRGEVRRPASSSPTQPRPRPVSRDQFDDVIKEFEVSLARSTNCNSDLQYIREYTINFDTCRRRANQAAHRLFKMDDTDDVASYDDVFSEISAYSYPDNSDLSAYTGVHDSSDLSAYSDVLDNSYSQADTEDSSTYWNLQGSACDDGDDYSDVYCERSGGGLPPPLPRRMSDTRPPARPPVPSCRRRQLSSL